VPDILEFDQVLALLQAAKDEDECDWLLLAVTFIHALRASESVALTADNIRGTRLSAKRRKGSKPVDDELMTSDIPALNERDALLALARITPGKQRLFPISTRTFQRRVHYYGERASLPEEWCHPHTLKHSILDYLRQTGMDLVEIQDRSGHVSLDSLRVYLHPKKIVTDGLVAQRLRTR
jgi:site-specific recombinase XerD